MHKRKRSPVADWLEAYAREPVHAATCVHRKGPRKGQINGVQLALHTGLEQATLHRILSGEIQSPDTATVQKIHEKTGRSVAEIRGEAPQIDLEFTPTAKAIARSFDQLPEAARLFTAQMISNVLTFQAEHPAIAKLMFTAPDPKRHAKAMKRIEEWQASHRGEEFTPPEE